MPLRSQFNTDAEWLTHLHLWFAGMALSTMIHKSEDQNGTWDPAAVAVGCYLVADAMLEQRNETK